MSLILAGLLLFTGAHLYLSVAVSQTAALRQRRGDNAVKGLVTLCSVAGITLLVFGWRSAQPAWIYTPPPALHGAALLLIVLSVYLFVVANRPSVIKRLLRHPQLTGVALWSAGHLLLNGDNRSLLLFAWLGLWAIVEMLLINRREGTWIKRDAPGPVTELLTVLVAGLVCAVLVYTHSWFAGVPVLLPG